MRKIFLILSLTVLMSVAAYAEFNVGGNLGLAAPSGDLADSVDPGYFINAFGEYFFTDELAARFDVGYSSMDGDYDANFSTVYVDILADYHFGDKKAFHPYLLAGAGMYNWEWEWDDYYYGSYSYDESDLGIVVGGGIRYPLQSFDINAEALGHYVMYDEDEEFTFTFGIGAVFGMGAVGK